MMERSPGHGLTTDHSSHDIRLYVNVWHAVYCKRNEIATDDHSVAGGRRQYMNDMLRKGERSHASIKPRPHGVWRGL